MDRVHRVTTEGLIEDKQGGFRSETGCVDQISHYSKFVRKCNRKKQRVYVSFMDLEKAYDRVSREAL